MNSAEVPADARWHDEGVFHTIRDEHGREVVATRHVALWERDGKTWGYWEWREEPGCGVDHHVQPLQRPWGVPYVAAALLG